MVEEINSRKTGEQCNHLFVYGTLAPGQSHNHLLHGADGTWQKASIKGKLHPRGFGATAGYPVVDVGAAECVISGHLLTSSNLRHLWPLLDDYEGDGYRRVMVMARLDDGSSVETFVYALA